MSQETEQREMVTFEDLASSTQFRNMSFIVQTLTGLRLALTDAAGNRAIAAVPAEQEAPLCRMLHTLPAGRHACRRNMLAQIDRATRTHNADSGLCHAGLHDILVPIYIEDRHVANFSCGQVLPEPPSEAGWRRFALLAESYPLDRKKLKDAYFSTPHLTAERLVAARQMIALMAEYFYEVGRRVKTPQEPGMLKVKQAREFIETHFHSQIRIPDVAAHVHMSPSYLSTLFRRHCGVTMVRYIEQVRITEARKLLLKRDKQITEIAYAVGFNSLTHFNRIFRRQVNCSPTQYRQRVAHLRDACLA